MPRFYHAVTVEPRDGGYAILLDGKPIRTPLKNLLSVENGRLATAIAGEWQAQGEKIQTHTMPLTQLANTAQDRVAPNPAAVIEALMDYAATDLLCYRAAEPEELALEQAAHFDPLLEWLEQRTGEPLLVARGLMPFTQPVDALNRIRAMLMEKSAPELTAIQSAAALCSSLGIAMALAEGEITAEEAFAAAFVDDLYQMRRWGEDEDAMRRLHSAYAELRTVAEYLQFA